MEEEGNSEAAFVAGLVRSFISAPEGVREIVKNRQYRHPFQICQAKVFVRLAPYCIVKKQKSGRNKAVIGGPNSNARLIRNNLRRPRCGNAS